MKVSGPGRFCCVLTAGFGLSLFVAVRQEVAGPAMEVTQATATQESAVTTHGLR